MKHTGIPLKNVRFDKNGKLQKFTKPRNASQAIAQKKSVKQKVVRRSP